MFGAEGDFSFVVSRGCDFDRGFFDLIVFCFGEAFGLDDEKLVGGV